MGDVGGIYTIPLRPQQSSSSLTHSLRTEALSLSLSSSVPPNSLAQDLRDSLRDLALASVRKLEKILLLRSCALGEALAAYYVCYS